MIISATNTLNSASSDPSAATIVPGERGPDVYLSTIGFVFHPPYLYFIVTQLSADFRTGDPIRFHQVLKNEAKFQYVYISPSHQPHAQTIPKHRRVRGEPHGYPQRPRRAPHGARRAVVLQERIPRAARIPLHDARGGVWEWRGRRAGRPGFRRGARVLGCGGACARDVWC